MRGVCGDEENGFADTCELDGEGTGSGGFAYASFAADEDPAEGLLLYYGFEGRGKVFRVGVNCCGHVGGELYDQIGKLIKVVEIGVTMTFLLQGTVAVNL